MSDTPLETAEHAPLPRRATVMSLAGLVCAALLAVLSALPAQYAVGHPGPTYDTLGDFEGTDLVAIAGAEVYESSGELRLTTVAVSRAATRPFTMGRVIQGWFSPSEYVAPAEAIFGENQDRDAYREASQVQWITSQEAATVAALEALEIEVPATLRVASVNDASNALGLLNEDDVIVALGNREMNSYSSLVDYMQAVAPGDVVSVTVERDGTELTESFATYASDEGGALMGILIDPDFDPPVDISVPLDTVGGPSAGMLFSLAIMEKLTEGDVLAGHTVAGTGGITIEGDVQPMGGVPQKMYAARDAGAQYFLIPQDNCEQGARHIPDGLVVIPVATLDEAFAALEAIGNGTASQLPQC